MWWDRLTLHIPIWIAFTTFGYQFGGGGAPVVEEKVVAVVEEVDIEWQRCVNMASSIGNRKRFLDFMTAGNQHENMSRFKTT